MLWNQRYLEISGLSAEFMEAGCTLREILEARQAQGNFPLDIDKYRRGLHEDIERGNTKSAVFENKDGRWCHVIMVPMSGGGWIATHEDITAQIAAKRIIEVQRPHLDAAVGNMSQGLCMFDKDQRVIICNRQYAELYGLTEELSRPGTPLRRFLEHWAHTAAETGDSPTLIDRRLARIATGKPYQIINHRRDGRYISVVHRPMADGGWVSTHEDVTEAKRREDSFRLLFDSGPMPMWVMDRETLKFLAVNDAVIARYGYSREQFLSMTVPELRAPEERENFAACLRALPEIQQDARTGKHYKSDGAEMDVEIYSRSLTDLPNRASFVEYLDATIGKAANSGEPFAILCVDLDRFKAANDVYGHLVGDGLLREAAHRLHEAVRQDQDRPQLHRRPR